ncbi:hypothetical protein [Egicoccus halophilus]|uniref:Uncharacterized protein n=1 Tax=Egicoccus halophilus TaxID=1670830 RepID=A0A8J3AAQ1_9ACTN|nr:hypothetical protein [Egicoccus halophilus]GGI09361.1 hypothetical protein GCM10011354_33690 [Egicoccus halophilus]
MTTASRDRERAAAIGNTEALGEVLRRETAAVAEARVCAGGEPWAELLHSDEYARILGAFIMNLINNERTNATERGVAIHDLNANALTQAVQQVRQGQT